MSNQKSLIQDLINELLEFKKFPMVDIPTIDAAIAFAKLRLNIDDGEKYLFPNHCKKVLATNNPYIDLPKVINRVEELAYSFSEEDVVEFTEWVIREQFDVDGYTQDLTTEALLKIWKEQKHKIVYYE